MQLFATGWFMSFFLNAFDFPVAVRVFDSFLCEGDKVLHRAAISILRFGCKGKFLKLKAKPGSMQHETEFEKADKPKEGVSLLCMPMGAVMVFTQKISGAIKNGDEMMEMMLSVKFSTKDLIKLNKLVGL